MIPPITTKPKKLVATSFSITLGIFSCCLPAQLAAQTKTSPARFLGRAAE
jgi:hypothetical protein